jgi:hypothetical protein
MSKFPSASHPTQQVSIMRINPIVTFFFVLISLLATVVHAAEQPRISLFDGKTLKGWIVQGGSAEVSGQATLNCGEEKRPSGFDEFDFVTEVRTDPGATAEICFKGNSNSTRDICVAVNNSRNWTDRAPRTGSLAEVRHEYKSVVRDGQWFKMRIQQHDHITSVSVNDVLLDVQVLCYASSEWPLTIRVGAGPAKVCFKHMCMQRVKTPEPLVCRLPTPDQLSEAAVRLDEFVRAGFPLINYHIHLKGDLTLEKALAHSRETGVFYGIAANAGLNFPITNDQGIHDYIKKMEGQPCFVGMQAEGREWPTLFSKEAIAKFDYVFTDAMTIVDHRGKRARLWMPEEVDIPDKQAFMELLVRTIEEILDNEPIDIYANPTYLPDVLIKEYDALWTTERVKRVIDAAARNGVAIEISNRLKLPKADFIRQAKRAGIKFTLGTNNVDSKLGREEYALQMIRECELKPGDMFLPKPEGKKPIQVRGFKSK